MVSILWVTKIFSLRKAAWNTRIPRQISEMSPSPSEVFDMFWFWRYIFSQSGYQGIYHFHEYISEQNFKMFSVTEFTYLHFTVLMVSTKKKVSYFKRVLANKIVLHFKWMGSKKQYLWYQWYNREEIKNSLMIDIKLHFFSLFNQAFFCKFISWNTVKPGLHPLKPQHDVVVVERVFYNIMTWKYTEIRLNVWLYVWIFKCVDNLLNVLFIFVNFSVSKWLLPL